MAFCTKCGSKLVEGETHQCPMQSAVSQQTISEDQTAAVAYTSTSLAPMMGKINLHQIIALIKNPFSSIELTAETGISYGVLGLITSALGMLFWFAAVYNNITSDIINLISLGKAFGLPGGSSIQSLLQLSYIKDFFVVALMVVVYIASMHFISNVMGLRKKDIKQTVAVLGSTQLIATVGFIVSALISYVSIPTSICSLVIVLITNIIIVTIVACDFYDIPTSKKVGVAALTIAVNIIISGLILQYFFKTEMLSMINTIFKTNYFSFNDFYSAMMQNIFRGL
ncbi:hypothetical protein DEAC_c39870 [Desulfosporosinus acididurans]|uniref:Yip1 domain protein n=1 Tax=Desulfosporosinus acididurans TaxID=476652 RepID=A0A0J1FLD3_9FIRM|nr:hypothetical protein [Desulfosporosinus acididurans]KLU64172.1 hypothetical protein DEAC_c39870 [Desulfosporosinus acididurans]